jgi:hypothetical protein
MTTSSAQTLQFQREMTTMMIALQLPCLREINLLLRELYLMDLREINPMSIGRALVAKYALIPSLPVPTTPSLLKLVVPSPTTWLTTSAIDIKQAETVTLKLSVVYSSRPISWPSTGIRCLKT